MKKRSFPWQIIPMTLFLLLGLYCRFGLYGYKATAWVSFAAALFFLCHLLLKKRRVLRRVLTVGALLVVLAVLAAEIPVIRAAKGSEEDGAPYLIVLGAGVNGTVPSQSLADRLRAAETYLNDHPESVAILSGGQGAGEDITEGQAMETWLVHHGIDAARLIKEERATSTEENLVFSFELIRGRGDDPADGVAILSSEYHLYRATAMAKRQGAKAVGVPAATSYPTLKGNYFLREGFAVWYFWVFG